MVLILSASCPQVNTVSLLSRNYSFADKQERTVGRSKVVQKFLPMVEIFSLYKYKNRTLSLRGFSAALRGTCPRFALIKSF